MAFVAVYDASVLYPSTTRDLLIRIAQAGLVQAKWTETILDEMFTNLVKNRPDLNVSLSRQRLTGTVSKVTVAGLLAPTWPLIWLMRAAISIAAARCS
jgi:hypothetical protein